MIKYIKGDVRSQSFDAEWRIIPHCCNDQGVMGSGVAAALASKWPEVKDRYVAQYQLAGFLDLGSIVPVPIMEDKTIVVNMIGQHKTMVRLNDKGIAVGDDGWPPIRYSALLECMRRTGVMIEQVCKDDVEIHCPKFGSDLAGGEWNAIEGMIHEMWGKHKIIICVYE
jgi:hypothetical protein